MNSFEEYVKKNGLMLETNNWKLAVKNAFNIIQDESEIADLRRAQTMSDDNYRLLVNAVRDKRSRLNPLLMS